MFAAMFVFYFANICYNAILENKISQKFPNLLYLSHYKTVHFHPNLHDFDMFL